MNMTYKGHQAEIKKGEFDAVRVGEPGGLDWAFQASPFKTRLISFVEPRIASSPLFSDSLSIAVQK